jgi:hypothetical protein
MYEIEYLPDDELALNLDSIFVPGQLRQAVADAVSGRIVWIIEDGKKIAAIVPLTVPLDDLAALINAIEGPL